MGLKQSFIVVATLLFATPAFAAKGDGKARTPRAGAAKRDAGAARPAAGTASASLRGAREPSPAISQFLSFLAMSSMGGGGSTHAHMFIEDASTLQVRSATEKLTPDRVLWRARGSYRKFKAPSGDGSLIVMFADKSGAYVHADGLVTIMGSDISGEVGHYEEVSRY